MFVWENTYFPQSPPCCLIIDSRLPASAAVGLSLSRGSALDDETKSVKDEEKFDIGRYIMR